MINTEFVSSNCDICHFTRVTLDEHYNLPQCFDFITVCPNHPAEVHFNISTEDMNNLVDQE